MTGGHRGVVGLCVVSAVIAGCASQPGSPAAATAVSVVPVAAAGSVPSSSPSGAAVDPGLYARLRLIAVHMAKGNGDPHPPRMDAVLVSDVQAADTALSGSTTNERGGPGYVIEVEGVFVCAACSLPARGAHAPSGTVEDAVLRSDSFETESGGISSRWVDLGALGKPFSLLAPTTAAPVPLVAVTAMQASAAPATESAGPAAPGPKTLAEAVARAKEATTNPPRATITVSATATAGQLRIAGLTIPASVPRTSPMFVVVLQGAAIFPSAAGQQDKKASQFALVFNADGSGRGDQVVYRGVFGLPAVPNARPPVATVVDPSQLSRNSFAWTAAPASARQGAVPVAAALAAIGPLQLQALAKPLAALVYVTTVHVHHRLAWVIETYGQLSYTSLPAGATYSGAFLQTGQTVVDATTGRYLVAATF